MLKLMKNLLFLLCILPTSLYASGPFGISWGQSLADFGVSINAYDYQYVITESVPKPYTSSTQYILIGNSDEGITGVKLKTHAFRAFSSDLTLAYDEARVYLEENGYEQVSVTESKLSSYQCIIQAICEGETWTGINAEGSRVLLKKTGVSHSNIFISMFFNVAS